MMTMRRGWRSTYSDRPSTAELHYWALTFPGHTCDVDEDDDDEDEDDEDDEDEDEDEDDDYEMEE